MCGRAFVLSPENHLITEEQRTLIERLLLERISLRGICRAVGVGLRWLFHFAVPVPIRAEPFGKLTSACGTGAGRTGYTEG